MSAINGRRCLAAYSIHSIYSIRNLEGKLSECRWGSVCVCVFYVPFRIAQLITTVPKRTAEIKPTFISIVTSHQHGARQHAFTSRACPRGRRLQGYGVQSTTTISGSLELTTKTKCLIRVGGGGKQSCPLTDAVKSARSAPSGYPRSIKVCRSPAAVPCPPSNPNATTGLFSLRGQLCVSKKKGRESFATLASIPIAIGQ